MPGDETDHPLARSGQTVFAGAADPTSAGTALLVHAREALAAVQHGRESVDAVAGLTQGSITLGTVPNLKADEFDLPAELARFHNQYPGIDIRLTEASTDELAAAVRESRLDATLLSLGPDPYEGLKLHPLARTSIVAAAHPDCWAPQHPIQLSDLAEHTLMTMPPGTGVRSILDAEFHRIGATPRIAFESGDPAMLARFARTGLGVAVIPVTYANGLICAEIYPPLTGQIALAWRNPPAMSPAAEAFVLQLVQSGATGTGTVVTREGLRGGNEASQRVPTQNLVRRTAGIVSASLRQLVNVHSKSGAPMTSSCAARLRW